MDAPDGLTRTLVDALADEPVAFAYLFGSLARGRGRAGSDVDVAVHFRSGMGARERLEHRLHGSRGPLMVDAPRLRARLDRLRDTEHELDRLRGLGRDAVRADVDDDLVIEMLHGDRLQDLARFRQAIAERALAT